MVSAIDPRDEPVMMQQDLENDDPSYWSVFDITMERFFRRLAGEKDEVIDYSVLSVAVLTLGLLLVVEFLRHKLDDAATGRPFFKTVLEGMYRELATLGIVEFGVYLLQKYASGYNKSMKAVFADVHFMLFFAALFNAVESVLLAICTSRVSDRMWVQTEQLDVDNYLELREEFERVDKELSGRQEDRTAEAAFEWNFKGIKFVRDGVRDIVRNPRLKRKHHKLLVQVRFHELRVHFLKANDLPLKLKVSDYLKRCELHVLMKMVHISPFAWLLLTGGLNLLYFVMGMVAYATENLETVDLVMYSVFFASLAFFVFMSLATFNKVKRVYRSIMHNKLIDARLPNEDSTQTAHEDKSHGEQEQRRLFWGGQPKYIIGISQLSQIGFAVALSIIIVFPDEIEGKVAAWQLFVVVAAGYALFLYIMARVIPRYTLCTSLGQLVDKSRLQETLAAYHLEEIQRKQQIRLEVQEAEKAYMLKKAEKAAKSGESDKPESPELGKEGIDSVKGTIHSKSTIESADESLASALDLALGMGKTWNQRLERSGSESSGSDRVLLAELVDTKTEDLRSVIPQEKLGKKTQSREERIKARRQARKKSVSDGVMAMRIMRPTKMSEAAISTLGSVDEDETKPSSVPAQLGSVRSGSQPRPRRRDRSRRRKSLSANAAVELMRGLGGNDETSISKSPMIQEEKPVPLHPLMEDIPIRSVPASEIAVPVGRQSLNIELEEDSSGRGEVPPPAASNMNGGTKNSVSFWDSVASEIPPGAAPSSESSLKDGVPCPNENDDVGTVDSSNSDDCQSDFDDIPDITESQIKMLKLAEKEPTKPLGDRFRIYFAGRMYKHISAVFGTMICFFLVGMRVETLLHATNGIPDTGNTWELTSGAAFWMETAWLCCFILISSLMTFLFRPGVIFDYKRQKCFLTGIMDVFLASLCLVLLMLSESKRSCSETEKRFLADNVSDASGVKCTQTFGNRVGEGVGNIEPFTSLVALRIFRFMVARRVVEFYRRKHHQSVPHVMESLHLGIYDETTRHGPHDASEQHSKASKQFENRTGTLVELWNYAIGLFPDIVEKYGEFSGELLQSMLGIGILDEQPMKSPSIAGADLSSPSNSSIGKTKLGGPEDDGIDVHAMSQFSYHGKQGASVRSVSDASSDHGSKTGSPTNGVHINASATAHSTVAAISFQAPLAPLEFKGNADEQATDMKRNADDASRNRTSPFIAPNARLIRSMRRCDRKLVPLLDTWTAVDVVMTKYELVYFEAPTDYENDQNGSSHLEPGERNETGRFVRKAVIATNGGKGMRLGDIAEGRKIVGRMELSSVDSVHVERIVPKRKEVAEGADLPACSGFVADEFWKSQNADEKSRCSRSIRWERVVQDDLIIESIHGMLYLRFYSDLVDTEASLDRPPQVAEDADLMKSYSLQWCQSIVRICGTQQLKQQNLPHFGEDNSDELRDYIVLVDPNVHEGNKIPRMAKMRRSKSTASMMSLDRKSRGLSRGSSIGTQDQSPDAKPQKHRRFSSLGTDITKGRDNYSDIV